MTTARKQQVSVEATPYYHCVSRCVRRSYLCGVDPVTEQSYEHRREWIQQKIRVLSQVYCIDICAYAIMSNHYHLVLHINREKALRLSDREVVERWRKEHRLPNLVERWLAGQLSSEAEMDACLQVIGSWRSRLWNISWFMKELNFYVSCKANQEDDCRGHFWESRFRSQALLDEKGLLAAMAYVDLNPLRAGCAKTPEESEFTSIKARLMALKNSRSKCPPLYPFVGHLARAKLNGIPFTFEDYIELVDWTARQYRKDKAMLSSHVPPILQRINIKQTNWLSACIDLERSRAVMIGCAGRREVVKQTLSKRRVHLFRLDG
ncbi:transposase [Vibrio panuliri]|uniref:transposase n=1 Tax=Vibrio panuliri TaxID=1381081 RepID=UPI000AAAAE36|nr:transposase [Vibrio panuliri]